MNNLKIINQKYIWLLSFIIITISFIIYKDFLLFKKLYVFNDSGADSLNIAWPTYGYFSDLIHNQDKALWSFNIGIGTNVFSANSILFDPFNIILFLFNKNEMVFALPYIQLLKILLAGIFFYLYLTYLDISKYVSMITAVLYAFNGYLILFGQHYPLSTVVVIVPLLLISFDRIISENKWLLFTLIIAITAIYSVYFLYILTIFLMIYALFRYFIMFKFKTKDFFVFFTKTFCYYMLGIGLSAIILFPSIFVILDNPRISGNFDYNIFKLNDINYYFALFSNFLSNDITIKGHFHPSDWWNYYEYPHVYAGLISLLLLPQIIYIRKPKKWLYLTYFFVFVLFLIVPFFSLMFTGFSGIYYRWTFLVIFIFLYCFSIIFNDLERGNAFSIRLLLYNFFAIIFIFTLIILIGEYKFNWPKENISKMIQEFKNIVIYLLLYVAIFVLYKYFKIKTILKLLLVIIICTELTSSSLNVVVNNRTLLSTDYVGENKGFYDNTSKAIAYLNEIDRDFYRIQKSYVSVSYADPMFQGYKSTTAFSSLNQPSYLKFLSEHAISPPFPSNTNVIGIPLDRHLINDYVSVKYIVSRERKMFPGYELIKEIDENLFIYKNHYFFPLGITYDSYITKDDFDKLSVPEKDEALLKYSVIDEDYSGVPKNINRVILNNKLDSSDPSNNNYSNLKFEGVELLDNQFPKKMIFSTTNNDPQIIINTSNISDKGKKIISFNLNSNIKDTGQLFWSNQNGAFSEQNSVFFEVEKGEKHYSIPINETNVEFLRLDVSNNKQNQFTLTNFDVFSYGDEYYLNHLASYKEYISERNSNPFIIKTNSSKKITGEVSLEKSKLLVFSIPFDKGWKIKVDGHNSEIMKVNTGFIGVPLTEGKHQIELSYMPPYLIFGLIVSISSLIIIILSILICKRKTINVFKKNNQNSS